ncbi:MAG TPA: hypothetical protein ENJ87_08220 [Gammaproteobacteria bacterium]|nr:hypothetical protein [Gammaproteobacteria bacterium]
MQLPLLPHRLHSKLLITIIFSVSSITHAGSDNYASFNIGRDNDDGGLFDAYVDIALTEALHIDLGAGQNTIDSDEGKFKTKQTQISLSGLHTYDEQSAISWSAGYRSWGKTDVIEARDTIFSVGYFSPLQWHVSLDYELGELKLFTRREFENRQKFLSSDRDAWRLSLDYAHDTGFVWISFLRRNYKKNLSLINQKRTLQRAIKRFALSQAFALSKEELTLGYEWSFEKLSLGADYNRIVSVIDNRRNQYASIFTRYDIGQDLTINFRIEQEIKNSFTVFTAGVGVAW